ncbi:MAG: cytochrome P450 [Hyphomonadaceae bacterium]|nr:cytochrome P450 [Hyphomonadaceae bacterium]
MAISDYVAKRNEDYVFDYDPNEDAWKADLKTLDISRAERFRDNNFWPFFERLRKEDPVHYCPDSQNGPYWSITKYNDIMAVDTNHQQFSSEPSIVLFDPEEDFPLPMFIAMDPPKHDVQRKTVSPIVAPNHLALLEPVIRERAGKLLDDVPRGEVFNWVDKISIELTTQMLATLFDFPWEDRRKLTRWSDVATAAPGAGVVESDEQRRMELMECLQYFNGLWEERANAPPRNDLISMLAHGESTKDMPRQEFLGNLVLLIVGGNDTTRNSITGSVYALNKFPEQFAKLRANPALIPNLVSETIRWQTPLAFMRRTALEDVEFGGKLIKKHDKVVMWYVSGNRDEDVIPNADVFDIERDNVRRHLSFGFGIHRCVGNRLGEMQLRIVWEEILKRFDKIEVMGEPKRVYSSFVKGYESLPVRVA